MKMILKMVFQEDSVKVQNMSGWTVLEGGICKEVGGRRLPR